MKAISNVDWVGANGSAEIHKLGCLVEPTLSCKMSTSKPSDELENKSLEVGCASCSQG